MWSAVIVMLGYPNITMGAEPIFRGVGVALLTLFDTDGELLVGATA